MKNSDIKAVQQAIAAELGSDMTGPITRACARVALAAMVGQRKRVCADRKRLRAAEERMHNDGCNELRRRIAWVFEDNAGGPAQQPHACCYCDRILEIISEQGDLKLLSAHYDKIHHIHR